MTVFKTRDIASSEIKLRWREPYISDASNIQIGAMSRGIYRGGDIAETVSSGTGFRIMADIDSGDTVFLHLKKTDGFGTIVRFGADIAIDMTSAVTWPLTSDQEWYVVAQVVYTTSDETTGQVQVKELSDLEANDIILGKMVLPTGATEILSSYPSDGYEYGFKIDGSNRTRPSERRGMVIPRAEVISASALRTSFQLSGRIYSGSSNDINSWVRLGYESSSYALTGSDGGQIKVTDWYDGVPPTTPITSGMLDGDNCFEDPYIKLDFSDTVDTSIGTSFRVHYYQWYQLDEIPFVDMFTTDPHAKDILNKSTSTSGPDNLSSGDLQSQISTLVGLINARVSTVNPTGSPSAWTLLWRSGNVTSNSATTIDTVSLWFKEGEFLYTKGGYPTVSDELHVNEIGRAVLIMSNSSSVRVKYRTTTVEDEELALASTTEWDLSDTTAVQDFVSKIAGRTIEGTINTTVSGILSAVMNGIPGTGSINDKVLLLELNAANIRVYWDGPSTENGGLYILHNGEWNPTTGLWQPIEGGYVSSMVEFSKGGLTVKRMPTTDASFSTGWTNYAQTWALGSAIIGESMYDGGVTFGSQEYAEVVISSLLTEGDPETFASSFNFRSARLDATILTSVTYSLIAQDSGYTNVGTPTFSIVDGYGGRVMCTLGSSYLALPRGAWAHFRYNFIY